MITNIHICVRIFYYVIDYQAICQILLGLSITYATRPNPVLLCVINTLGVVFEMLRSQESTT